MTRIIRIKTGPLINGIATNLKSERVKAEIFNLLAVHESVTGNGPVTLTHAPTGLAVQRDLTYQQAVDMALVLGRLDWNFQDPKHAAAFREDVARALAVVKGAQHVSNAA